MERFGGYRGWDGGAGFYGEEGTSRWTPAWGTCARRAGQGHPWVRQSLARHILPPSCGVSSSGFPALIYHLAFFFFFFFNKWVISHPNPTDNCRRPWHRATSSFQLHSEFIKGPRRHFPK